MSTTPHGTFPAKTLVATIAFEQASNRAGSDRFHQIVRRRTLGRDVDCEQGRRLRRARIARDPMDRTRRFPPGIAGMEHLLGSVTDLRDDGTGNDECHDAISVKMRRGTYCRRI